MSNCLANKPYMTEQTNLGTRKPTCVVSILADKNHMQICSSINQSILILGLGFVQNWSARTGSHSIWQRINGKNEQNIWAKLSEGWMSNLFIGITVLQSVMTVKNLMTWGELLATAFSNSTSKQGNWLVDINMKCFWNWHKYELGTIFSSSTS